MASSASSDPAASSSDDLVEDATAPPLAASTRSSVERLPLLSVRAGPRDGDAWLPRLKQELHALIQYAQQNKRADQDWFVVQPSDALGTKWSGKCWCVHGMHKFEFRMTFELPVSYPVTPFEVVLPELEGRSVKMYRGGKICLSSHFKPLWSKNVPHFGIAHELAMGLGPWLAAEIPHLVDEGQIDDTDAYKQK